MHRIESRNAFVACVNNHATGDLVVFLICEHCGAVGEAASAAVADQLKAAARAGGLHAEGAGDRDRRRLRPLPAARPRLMSQVPASHTRPLDAAGMALVVFICLTWGFNQPAIKLAIHDVPPLIQCAIRSSLATLIVLGLMRLRGLPIAARDGTLGAGLIAGALFGLSSC